MYISSCWDSREEVVERDKGMTYPGELGERGKINAKRGGHCLEVSRGLLKFIRQLSDNPKMKLSDNPK
jgi:hypothetical protein